MARFNSKADTQAKAEAAKAAKERSARIQTLADAVKVSGDGAASVQSLVIEAFKVDDSIILRAAENAATYFANLANADTNERQRRRKAAIDILRTQIKRALVTLNKGAEVYEMRALKVDKDNVASWKAYEPREAKPKAASEPPTADNASEALAYLRAVVVKMVEQAFLTEKQAAAMLALADGEEPAQPKMKRAA